MYQEEVIQCQEKTEKNNVVDSSLVPHLKDAISYLTYLYSNVLRTRLAQISDVKENPGEGEEHYYYFIYSYTTLKHSFDTEEVANKKIYMDYMPMVNQNSKETSPRI